MRKSVGEHRPFTAIAHNIFNRFRAVIMAVPPPVAFDDCTFLPIQSGIETLYKGIQFALCLTQNTFALWMIFFKKQAVESDFH